MPGWFQLGQLGFALFVALLIADRVRLLCWRAPLSDAAQKWLLAALRTGDAEAVARLRAARPECHAARILAADDGADVNELLGDLREEARARLMALRVCATLASTTGLLGGILALSRGDDAAGAGLLALKAGAVAQARVSEAITTMAIGVAVSAVCFSALSTLQEAAKRLVAQDVAVARGVEGARRVEGASERADRRTLEVEDESAVPSPSGGGTGDPRSPGRGRSLVTPRRDSNE